MRSRFDNVGGDSGSPDLIDEITVQGRRWFPACLHHADKMSGSSEQDGKLMEIRRKITFADQENFLLHCSD